MIVLACEVLQPELELLASKMQSPPEMVFLSQRLHDYPDKLRAGVQEEIDRIERDKPHIGKIAMGYGLCGKGLTGVSSKRVTLIYPRLHDCIPFLLGHEPDSVEASSREGTTYWISAGWLKSFLVEFHLGDTRFKMYAEKFGEKRAERMVKAENALLDNYKTACHIRWDELGDQCVADARAVAEAAGLAYSEQLGRSDYLRRFLVGPHHDHLFIKLAPGQTLDMDTDGKIISTDVAARPAKEAADK